MARVGADGIFRKVKVRMWRSGSFSRLSPMPPSGQGLWLYLLTCPESCSIPGAIVAGRAQLAEALDWPVEKFAACWGEIAAERMAMADWRARLVWLPRGPYENPPANPNVVKAWASVFRTLPDCELKARIYSDIRDFMKAYGEAFSEAFTEAFGKAFMKARGKGGVPREREREREREEGEVVPPLDYDDETVVVVPPQGGTAAATTADPELPPDDDQEPELPPAEDSDKVANPEANAYPWHPDDEEAFGQPDHPHPRWDDYVEVLSAKRTPAPWPRFHEWLEQDAKRRAAAPPVKIGQRATNPVHDPEPYEPHGGDDATHAA